MNIEKLEQKIQENLVKSIIANREWKRVYEYRVRRDQKRLAKYLEAQNGNRTLHK